MYQMLARCKNRTEQAGSRSQESTDVQEGSVNGFTCCRVVEKDRLEKGVDVGK